MTMSFVVMGAGVFVAGTLAAAVVVALTIRFAQRWAEELSPRSQGIFWLLLAAAPVLAGATALLATLLPSFGLAIDHCPTHASHHPHLCLHHPQSLSIPAASLALALLLRFGAAVTREVRAALRAARVIAALAPVASVGDDLVLMHGSSPVAFVVGLLRPRVYVSEATMQLPPCVLEPVLAHERAHIAHRHLLVRLAVRLMAACHLPSVARDLEARLVCAQELQADACAARATGDPLLVAESLLRLARARSGSPQGALAFSEGAVTSRIIALTGDAHQRRAWPLALIVTIATLMVAGAVSSPAAVHHAFETLLGWPH